MSPTAARFSFARLLLDPRGAISRITFIIATVSLVVMKIAGDFALARLMFHTDWSWREYLFPSLGSFKAIPPPTGKFDATMLLWATPFAWIGLCLLAKRLRSARAPTWLLVFFFVPIAKFFLFAMLCALPDRSASGQSAQPREGPKLRKWAPENPLLSAALAITCSTAIGVLSAIFATEKMRAYTTWLFLALPFLMGFLAAWIHGLARPRTLAQSLLAAYLSLILTGGILLSISIEGLICLVMAAPIAICEATAGGWIAHSLNLGGGGPSALATCLTLPILIAVETATALAPTTFSATSELAINAPPEIVWQHVIAFEELPPPRELLFRLGIAYPTRAHIDGSGVGTLRHCVFSTGEFVEPITVWDKPSLLAFDVVAEPVPLIEISPFQNLQTPHLHGYFKSHRGEFRLIRTSTGTLLRGTTWYSHRIEPEAYWKLWSEALIHRIHFRVLEQIKREAEIDAGATMERPSEASPP